MDQQKPQKRVSAPHGPELDKREVVSLRVKTRSVIAMNERAEREGCSAADLQRRLLAYAMLHMPDKWGVATEA